MLLQSSVGGTPGGGGVNEESPVPLASQALFCSFLAKCWAQLALGSVFKYGKGKGAGYRVSVFVSVLCSALTLSLPSFHLCLLT